MKRLTGYSLLVLILAGSIYLLAKAACADDIADNDINDRVERIIRAASDHAQRYPAATGQDIFKFLYQACYGPGHMNNVNYAHTERYLMREWEALGNQPISKHEPPLLEDMGSDFVRINLIPYRDKGGGPEVLAEAFHSSMKAPVDSTLFSKVITRVESHYPDLLNGYQAEHFIDDERVVPHHSNDYRQNYHPHYRLLTIEEADLLLESMQNHDK